MNWTMKDEVKKGKPVDPEHMRVIETNLPLLTEFCGMKAYAGDKSTESLTLYMKEAEDILKQRGNKASMKEDAMKSAFIREHGKEELLKLKRENYNLKLEDCVIGADQRRMLDVIDGYMT